MARRRTLRRQILTGFSVLLVLTLAISATAVLSIGQAGRLFPEHRSFLANAPDRRREP